MQASVKQAIIDKDHMIKKGEDMYKLYYQDGSFIRSSKYLNEILGPAVLLSGDEWTGCGNYFYKGAITSMHSRLASYGVTHECFNGEWFIITYHEGETEADDMDRSGPSIEVNE